VVVFDIERVRRDTFVADVEFHPEVDSTNSRAAIVAAKPNLVTPLLVLAERQTAGRGRGTNVWWSAPGSLTFSLLFDAATIGVPIDRWPQVSLAVALAIRQTIAELLPREVVQVKWPNDVFLNARKVAGILVEVPPVRPQKLVVGIGVNVNNSFAAAPPELHSIATSLIDAAQSAQLKITNYQLPISDSFDLTEILVGLLQGIDRELPQLKHATPNLTARWRPHCFLQGRTVQVTSGPTTHVGVCEGIDDTGALILHSETGVNCLLSGVVTSIGTSRLI
jgi:BirA family biotin operon repressor/biotin-[acetyl-CoA-carboxylase] ligase